jgi:hypothetical protein
MKRSDLEHILRACKGVTWDVTALGRLEEAWEVCGRRAAEAPGAGIGDA